MTHFNFDVPSYATSGTDVDDNSGTSLGQTYFDLQDGTWGYMIGPIFTTVTTGPLTFTVKLFGGDFDNSLLFSHTYDWRADFGTPFWLQDIVQLQVNERTMIVVNGAIDALTRPVTAMTSSYAFVAFELSRVGGVVSTAVHAFTWADVAASLTLDQLPSGYEWYPSPSTTNANAPDSPSWTGDKWLFILSGQVLDSSSGAKVNDMSVVMTLDMGSGVLESRFVAPFVAGVDELANFLPSIASCYLAPCGGGVFALANLEQDRVTPLPARLNVRRVSSSGVASAPIATAVTGSATKHGFFLRAGTGEAAFWTDAVNYYWITSTAVRQITDDDTIRLLMNGYANTFPLLGRGPGTNIFWVRPGSSEVRQWHRGSGSNQDRLILDASADVRIESASYETIVVGRVMPPIAMSRLRVLASTLVHTTFPGWAGVHGAKMLRCITGPAPDDTVTTSTDIAITGYRDDLLAGDAYVYYGTANGGVFNDYIRSVSVCSGPSRRAYAIGSYPAGAPWLIGVHAAAGTTVLSKDFEHHESGSFGSGFVYGFQASCVVQDDVTPSTTWHVALYQYTNNFSIYHRRFLVMRLSDGAIASSWNSYSAGDVGFNTTFCALFSAGVDNDFLQVEQQVSTIWAAYRMRVSASGVSEVDGELFSGTIINAERDSESGTVVVYASASGALRRYVFADGVATTSATWTSWTAFPAEQVTGGGDSQIVTGDKAIGSVIPLLPGAGARWATGHDSAEGALTVRGITSSTVVETNDDAIRMPARLGPFVRGMKKGPVVAVAAVRYPRRHVLAPTTVPEEINDKYPVQNVLTVWTVGADNRLSSTSVALDVPGFCWEQFLAGYPWFVGETNYNTGLESAELLDNAGRSTGEFVLMGDVYADAFPSRVSDDNFLPSGGRIWDDPQVPGGPFFTIERSILWGVRVKATLAGFSLRVGTIALD